MSDETGAGDSGAAAPEVPSAPAAPSAPEVIEVTEAMPPEIAQEIAPMPDAIPQVAVPEIVPEIVPIESGEVPAPQSSAPLQNPPPQPAASAAPLPPAPPPPTSPPPATPASAPPSQSPAIKDRRPEALEAKQSKKRANLGKIMQLVAAKGTTKNDDVEKLLHVSNATATRYLMQLVREGKLQKVGTRRGAHYVPV